MFRDVQYRAATTRGSAHPTPPTNSSPTTAAPAHRRWMWLNDALRSTALFAVGDLHLPRLPSAHASALPIHRWPGIHPAAARSALDI